VFLYVAAWTGWTTFLARLVVSDWLEAGRPDFRRWTSPRFVVVAVVLPTALILVLRSLLIWSSPPHEQPQSW
jgi:hypothetical protein